MSDAEKTNNLEPMRVTVEVPRDLPTHFVTNMGLAHTPEGEFVMTFFEVMMPPVGGETPVARAVARVGLTATRMAEFIDAMSRDLASWQESTQVAEESDA